MWGALSEVKYKYYIYIVGKYYMGMGQDGGIRSEKHPTAKK